LHPNLSTPSTLERGSGIITLILDALKGNDARYRLRPFAFAEWQRLIEEIGT